MPPPPAVLCPHRASSPVFGPGLLRTFPTSLMAAGSQLTRQRGNRTPSRSQIGVSHGCCRWVPKTKIWGGQKNRLWLRNLAVAAGRGRSLGFLVNCAVDLPAQWQRPRMWICVGPRDPLTKPSRGWLRVVVRKPRSVNATTADVGQVLERTIENVPGWRGLRSPLSSRVGVFFSSSSSSRNYKNGVPFQRLLLKEHNSFVVVKVNSGGKTPIMMGASLVVS